MPSDTPKGQKDGHDSGLALGAGSVLPWREREHWGVGYTPPGADFFLICLCESEAKARTEADLRNNGPRRFSWEQDMVWSVKHYPAAEPVRCENCGKLAVKVTEDGINLCRECYALCPEDTPNSKR